MNPPARKLPWTIGIGLLLLFLTVALLAMVAEVRREITRNKGRLPVQGSIAAFTLTNQNGAPVSLADLRGHVWVADIIFTRCTGPCLRMTRQMKELQDAVPAASPARFVTLTTDPEFDTAPVLKTYAQRAGADPSRWLFLTGTKKEIGALATGSLNLSGVEVPAAKRESDSDLFIHSTLFVVVDKQGRFRGKFETGGEGVDWPTEKKKILAAIDQLGREQ